MKYRKDFVTNSSSSSYVCEICGRSESGWDINLRECEMMECVNGHTFCCDEALDINPKELIQIILENEYNKKYNNYKADYSEDELVELGNDELIELVADGGYYDVPECVCPICQFIEYSEYDLSKYLEREYKINRDTVFAQVKELNKRRKKLYENEYITYVCKEFNLNPTEIVAEWKEKYGTYSKLRDFLNGK